MKQHVKIFSLVLIMFSMMAFGFINWNDLVVDQQEVPITTSITLDKQKEASDKADFDFAYNVDSRYMATVTKEELHKATSILDIIPETAGRWWKEVPFSTVKITLLHEESEIGATTENLWSEIASQTTTTDTPVNEDVIVAIEDNRTLNAKQIELLKSMDYSTNFYIEALGTTNPDTGQPTVYAYYFTVVPEKEAEFAGGYDALIEYLKEGSKKEAAFIGKGKVRPGKVNFTITKKGTVESVKLTSSSGYIFVDKTMIELITNTPGNWKPAENSKGERVEQELTFSFGAIGC